VVIRKSGDQVSHVRVALTNVAPAALRVEAAEAALLGKPFNADNVQAAVQAAIAACDPAEDLRGDIEYKTAMAGEMVKRALNKAWSRCA
jgi:carbon-monoxide dehydrogenase medium subunit